jgi:hypothetical protein
MADLETNNRFQIQLPEDWIDQSVYIFNGPEAGGFHHNLSLVIDNGLSDDDLEAFAQERIDAYLNATPAAELLKNERKTFSNGTEAIEVVVKWVPTDNKVIFQKRVFMVIDDVGYSFTANFTKQTIKTIGLQVDEMINSFSPGG